MAQLADTKVAEQRAKVIANLIRTHKATGAECAEGLDLLESMATKLENVRAWVDRLDKNSEAGMPAWCLTPMIAELMEIIK